MQRGNKIATSGSYWSAEFRVADAVPVNRFEEIKKFIHCADNAQFSTDKLKKIRPLLNFLRERFATIPLEENLSVDEQMIPFKGISSLKQYMAKKPHKWGYKMFVLSGVSGFAYNLELYAGKDDNVLMDGEVDCGAGSNVVIRLARTVPSDKNHKLYFDNYFNCPDLQIYLACRGILSLGTVRMNRVPQVNMPSE